MEQPQRRVVHISWSTFARTLTCIAPVWLWLRIWQWVLVFVVGAFLAVALDPAADWLARRRIKRSFGAPLLVGAIAVIVVLFILAVIAAFSVGAELGGVIGALIALPIAALWPVIEQHWLADRIGHDVVSEQRRVEQTEPH